MIEGSTKGVLGMLGPYSRFSPSSARRGMALILVLLQIAVLALVVAALGSLALKNLRSTSMKSWQRQARHAAYAGVQASLAQLDHDSHWQPSSAWTEPLGDGALLRYEVEVLNNVHNPSGAAALAPDGTWIPAGAAWVRSRGYLGDVGSDQDFTLIALVARARPSFNHAIFGHSQVALLNGSQVNSYTSSVGRVPQSGLGPDATHLAHLGTNSIAANAISLVDSWSDGNAFAGLSSAPTSVISLGSGSTLTGARLSLADRKALFRFRSKLEGTSGPTLRIPELHAGLYNFLWETSEGTGDQPRESAFESLQVSGNHPDWGRATNLFSGEYYITGDLIFYGSSAFRASLRPTVINVHANTEFPVVIYVRGNVQLDNVRVNTVLPPGVPGSPSPRTLQIYTLTDGATFDMKNSELHAVVAGRGLNVTIAENSELFGAVIADRATVDNSKVHYDRALTGVTLNGRTAWDVLSLKEATEGESRAVTTPAKYPQPPSLESLALDPQVGTRRGGTNPPTAPSTHVVPATEMLPPPPPAVCPGCGNLVPDCVCQTPPPTCPDCGNPTPCGCCGVHPGTRFPLCPCACQNGNTNCVLPGVHGMCAI